MIRCINCNGFIKDQEGLCWECSEQHRREIEEEVIKIIDKYGGGSNAENKEFNSQREHNGL